MTYFEEAFPEGRKDGTIYGVPYTYSLERDRYILPDGTHFNGEDFGSLCDYVAANLAMFSDTVLGKKAHNDMMDAITYSMTAQKTQKELDDLNALRWEISQRNEKAQKEWDKKFNAEVLKLVSIAIERGSAQWHWTTPQAQPINTLNYSQEQYIVGKEIKHVTIIYNMWLGEMEAYRDVREQAEKAVRMSLSPPKLQPMP